MREILFRGKRKDNKKWIYGFLIMNKYTAKENGNLIYITKPNIIPIGNIGEADYDGDGNYYEYEVIPETVGQYTGLKDKNGRKIFEGDIILYGLIPCVVKNDTENARFMLYKKGKYIINGFNADTMKLKEVIGNIHDNPELMKGGAE